MILNYIKNATRLKRRISDIKQEEVLACNSSIKKIKKKITKEKGEIDKLIKYYLNFPLSNKPRIPEGIDTFVSRSTSAIGDCVNSGCFFEAAFRQGKKRHLVTTNRLRWIIKEFCPYYLDGEGKTSFAGDDIGKLNCGNGSLLQQFHRLLGLVPPVFPKATLVTGEKRHKDRWAICFTTGPSAFVKNNFQFPRQLLPGNYPIIQKIINEHKEIKFIEFGKERCGLKGLGDFTGKEIKASIIELSKCDGIICLNSGFHHLGLALGLRTIMIINIPRSEDTWLPALRHNLIADDLAWINFSPLSIVLHQDGTNGVVPEFSYQNLNKAIFTPNEIYPYDGSVCYLPFEKEWAL